MPDDCSMQPMNTKRGKATSVSFAITENTPRTIMSRLSGPKVEKPIRTPMLIKTVDTGIPMRIPAMSPTKDSTVIICGLIFVHPP